MIVTLITCLFKKNQQIPQVNNKLNEWEIGFGEFCSSGVPKPPNSVYTFSGQLYIQAKLSKLFSDNLEIIAQEDVDLNTPLPTVVGLGKAI